MSEKRVSGADSPLVIDNSGSGGDDKETAESVRKQDSNWEPYEGPRGGSGWHNTETGEVVYDDDFSPGEDSKPESDGSENRVQEISQMLEDNVEERSFNSFLNERQVVDTAANSLSRVKSEDMVDNVLTSVESVTEKGGRSGYNPKTGELSVSSKDTESTVIHEFGHAIIESNGLTVDGVSTLFSRTFDRASGVDTDVFGQSVESFVMELFQEGEISSSFRDKVIERFGGQQLEIDSILFSEKDENVDDSLTGLTDTINDTLTTVIKQKQDGDGPDPIKEEYEFTNSHEFFAAIHENLQQEGINRNNIETIYDQYPEVLDAYFEVFEPNDLQKRELNQLFKESGGSGPIESEPFPEVNND